MDSKYGRYRSYHHLRLQQPHLYYDTLAAIDHQGDWYYPSYSCNVLYIISLAQWTLFQTNTILPIVSWNNDHEEKSWTQAPMSIAKSTLWPMQSCFGGLAIYDWNTGHSQTVIMTPVGLHCSLGMTKMSSWRTTMLAQRFKRQVAAIAQIYADRN
jgi:hypothetical protein